MPAVTDDPAALLERALAILAEDSAAWQERRPAPSASEAAAEAPQAVDRPARGGSGS